MIYGNRKEKLQPRKAATKKATAKKPVAKKGSEGCGQNISDS